MTVERHAAMTRDAGVTTLPFGRKIEELRMVKDAEELELIETACRLSDAALAEVLPQIGPGMSERTVATLLDHPMAVLGADAPRSTRSWRAARTAPSRTTRRPTGRCAAATW